MRKIFTLLCLLCCFFQLQGQDIGNYQLTENQNVGTLTDMSGSTQLIRKNRSLTASGVVSMGFDFVFMGKVYNSFSVNTNGVLRLGDEQVLPEANTYGIPGNDRIVPFAGAGIYRLYRDWRGNVVYSNPVEADLGTGNEGKVHYRVTGSAPSRVLVVEWRNMQIPKGSGSSDITFQVRLYESSSDRVNGSGKIEFIYDKGKTNSNYAYFSFRTGFGIGPEQGNFVALDHESRAMVAERNHLSEHVYGDISFFGSTGENDKLLYRFEVPATVEPAGVFSDFEIVCPAPNALTVRFSENCPDEAGIAVYRKVAGQPDKQFQFVTSLPPDARAFSDGDAGFGTSYVYRFYLLGESRYASTYTDYTTERVTGGVAMQAIKSGNWTNTAVWGGAMPENKDDVELGCVGSVFVTANGDAQVHNLTIQQGSFLTIADGVTLSVSGNFINNGVFNPVGTGRLLLNGQELQVLENNGKGITDDELFTSQDADQRWYNEVSTVRQTLEVNAPGFEAIKSVKVNVRQAFLRDVSVYLITPDNQRYALAISRGQGGSYIDAVFTDTGKPLPPTVQNEDLEGEYRPEESFSAYSGPFNGTWTLEVKDAMTGEGGVLTGFELTLSRGGSNDLVMKEIAIDNSSQGGVVLNSGLLVQGEMELTNGIVHGSEEVTVLFDTDASCNEGNGKSYIDGTVLKKGTSDFTFPLGDGGQWAPLSIENLRNADTETVFKATFHKEGPGARDQLGEKLVRVSGLEYWDLSPEAGTAMLNVVLHYKNADSSKITNISPGDLVVAHYTDGIWENEGGEIVAGSAVGPGAAGAVRAYDINTFSPFTFGSQNGGNPLPVELVTFKARAEAKVTVLSWETASELNNSHFEVERSYDGTLWTTIGTVNGMGTTSVKQTYSFEDEQIRSGLSYYRLRQVDYDGAFEYSTVVRLQRTGAGEVFTFHPNPAQNHIFITSSIYPAELALVSQQGSVVWKKGITSSETKIDLPDLPAGVYMIRLQHSGGVEYRRLVIADQSFN